MVLVDHTVLANVHLVHEAEQVRHATLLASAETHLSSVRSESSPAVRDVTEAGLPLYAASVSIHKNLRSSLRLQFRRGQ